MSSTEDQGQGPVIRDRRRIDPATGQVREPAEPGPQRGPGSGQPRPGRHSASSPGGQPGGDQRPAGGQEGNGKDRSGSTVPGNTGPGNTGPGNTGPASPAAGAKPDAGAAAMLAERTADLQRLQAEYANYRKRVERDRQAVREQALANVLSELLPVLDDIGRAREHGELSGGFKSVADSLESITSKLGLTAYGEQGDPFDPMLHEALMHEYSGEVFEPTCVKILQPGYKVGDRIIRPARVAVAEPEGGGEPAGEATDGDDGSEAAPDGAEN
jgi:molecular chaperone GrpE